MRWVSLRATATESETKKKTKVKKKGWTKKNATLPSQIAHLTEEEKQERLAKALDIWEGMKLDVKDEMERYQTFRLDKFESMLRSDTRGKVLLDLYKPGTPEYAEFFENHMGPYVFEMAKSKLGEGLQQVAGVLLFVAVVVFIVSYFGSDIINFILAPFTGFASDFVRLYGF